MRLTLSSSQILTFDNRGITMHPNHLSIPYGVLHMLSSYPSSSGPPPKLYTLISLPVVQKYIGPSAFVLAKFDLAFLSFLRRFNIDTKMDLPVFVSGIREYFTALHAMVQHRTQSVWYRWLNVLFSRYLWVNQWVEVKPQGM